MCELENIEIPFLGKLLNIEDIETVVTKRLTAPGENYGSLILSLDIITKSSPMETLNLVVKLLPPSEEMKILFDCPLTVWKEIGLYKNIVPKLSSAVCFPVFCGGRLNIQNSDGPIDDFAVLVLENLKVKGYHNVDRLQGFNMDGAKLVLSSLAKVHASFIALKFQDPGYFRTMKPFLKPFVLEGPYMDVYIRKYHKLIREIEEVQEYYDKLKNVNLLIYPRNPKPPQEPFATLSHNDCWVNNIMVNGSLTSCKFVDFQLYDYGSPAKDVLFFLFTSVDSSVLQKNLDELLQYYYESFSENLATLDLAVRSELSFECFLKEIEREAKESQFAHIALLLPPLFAEKGAIADISELKMEEIGNQKPSRRLREKFLFIVREFVDRNWL